MKAAKVTIGVDTPAIKKAIDEMVARVVNEAAKSLADIRAWCDTEAAVIRACPGCTHCVTRGRIVDEIRALLPSLPEAGEVTEVDGTRVTPDGDEQLPDREL